MCLLQLATGQYCILRNYNLLHELIHCFISLSLISILFYHLLLALATSLVSSGFQANVLMQDK